MQLHPIFFLCCSQYDFRVYPTPGTARTINVSKTFSGDQMLRTRVIPLLLSCSIFFSPIINASTIDRLNDKNSTLLVLNKAENTLVLIDTQNMTITARIPVGEGPHEVIATAHGKLAIVANYGTQQVLGSSLSVIDIEAKKERRRIDLGGLRRPHGLAEAGGKIYFTCEVNRVIARFDPATEKIDWLMGTGQDATHMITATADQKKIYTANIRSNNVTAFDFSTPPTKVIQIPVANQPEGIDLSPDGKEVWVGHRGSGNLSVIDTASNKVIEAVKSGGDPYRVRFTPDGKKVLISNPQDNELIVIEAATRKEVKRIHIDGAPASITVSADSQRAYVTTIQANGIAAIDLASFSVIKTLETGKGPDGIALATN